MGTGKQRRTRTHKKHLGFKKSRDVKRRAKDIDQIQDEMKAVADGTYKPQEIDPDLPGLGQFYCLTCARHFMDRDSLEKHSKTRPHKRRLKKTLEEQYTQEEADRGGGMGAPDNGKPRSLREVTAPAAGGVKAMATA